MEKRKSLGELGSIRRLPGELSARKHPLSSRGWGSMHSSTSHHASPSHNHNRRHSAAWLWHVGSICVRFIIRARKCTSLPRLTSEETRDVTLKFYEVMCLNTVPAIREFLASSGIRMGAEDEQLLKEIAFREGRALTLYQVIRLMVLVKRRLLVGAGSDTAEAFTALAVNGRIPRDVFRATLMRFDLRVPLQDSVVDPRRASNAAPPRGHDALEDSHLDSPNSTGPADGVAGGGDEAANGIDLQQFTKLLSVGDDAEKSRHRGNKKDNALNKSVTRLNSVQREDILQHLHADSASHSGAVSPQMSQYAQSDAPKPLDAILHHVRQNLDMESPIEHLLSRKSHQNAASEKSPVRSEVFPFRQSKKKWDFHDVASRIEEVEHRHDVRRPTVSRNVRYCSQTERPPLALLTPFTDLTKNHAFGEGSRSRGSVPAHLTRLPPRGLPPDAANLLHGQQKRSASVPLSDKYPILSQRRERLMQALPHRDFMLNGTTGWLLSKEQRRLAADRAQWGQSHRGGSSDDGLQHMAAATLGLIRSRE